MPLLSHFLCFLSLSLFTNLEGLAQIPSSLWKLFLIFSPHIPWKIRQNDSLPFTFPCFHGTKMLLCFITSCYTLLLINQFPSLSVSCLRKPVTRVLYPSAQWWAHNGYPVNDRSTVIHPGLKAEMCYSSLTPPFALSPAASAHPVILPPEWTCWSIHLLCLHPDPGHHSLSLRILQLYSHWSLHIHFYSFQTILCTAANSLPCVK